MPAPRRPLSDETLASLHALAQRQGGLLRWDQVLALGVSDSQAKTLVRRGELVRVRRGVLCLPTAVAGASAHVLDYLSRWKSLPPGAVLSHGSAALLHGLQHVDVPEAMAFLLPRPARGAADRPHLGALPPEHVEVIHGMPVTTAARTVADLLRCVPDELAAQVVADGALRAGVAADEVTSVLASCSGWPGVRQARVAWAHADARAESPLESQHRALFRRLGLPPPETQVVIRDAAGRIIARVDFLFREQCTVVESDGRVKYDSAATVSTLWDEKRREDALRDTGLEVVRATHADTLDGGLELDARVRRAFARAAARRRPAA